jgi:hypothetical protein
MKLPLIILALSLHTMTIHGSIDASPEVFFKPAPLMPAEEVNDQLYPKGNLFPFSFYSVGGGPRDPSVKGGATLLPEEEMQAIFRDLTESGFQIVGPQYSLASRVFDDAKAHQLKIIYSVGLEKKEFRAIGQEVLPIEEIAARIRKDVTALAENSSIVAWDLKPEELRPWRKNELDYLTLAVAAVRDADPLKRPIYHYCPGHYSAEGLAGIAPHVDLLGKGMYTNYSSQKTSRVWCRWSVEQEVEAIRQSGSSAIPLALPEMFQQPDESELSLIPDWVRHDVYLGLVSGAKGVLVFSLRQRTEFPAWRAYFDAYRQLGRELLKGEKLGQIFLFGEKRGELAVEIIKGPKTTSFVFPSANIKEPIVYPSISWADIAHGNHRYLIAVNSSNEACTAIISGFPYDAVKAETLFESQPSFNIGEGEFETDFKPLEVKIYRFSRK